MVGIRYLDYYLPSNKLEAREVLKMSKYEETRDDEYCECFINQSKQMYVAIEKEKNEIQIFSYLFEKLFNNSGLKPGDIDYIIYTSPKNWMINDVCIPYYLSSHFKLKNASIFEMTQECVTTMQSIQLASALVKTGMAKNIIILSISYGREDNDRFTGSTLVGDGAGLLLVSNEDIKIKFINGLSKSDGKYSYYKYNKMTPKITGLEIAKKGTEHILKYLMEQKLLFEDIFLIVPQNINYSEYKIYSDLLNIPIEKYYFKNISDGGHLGEVDSIRNLTDILEDNNISKDKKILLFGSGTIADGMDSVYNMVLLNMNI